MNTDILLLTAILILTAFGLYIYLDPETCWSNIKTPADFIELLIQRTKQRFCRHDWKIGKTCMYCTKCYHTKKK